MTSPPSTLEKPGMLCPPERTATVSSSLRANSRRGMTSDTPAHWATSAG